MCVGERSGGYIEWLKIAEKAGIQATVGFGYQVICGSLTSYEDYCLLTNNRSSPSHVCASCTPYKLISLIKKPIEVLCLWACSIPWGTAFHTHTWCQFQALPQLYLLSTLHPGFIDWWTCTNSVLRVGPARLHLGGTGMKDSRWVEAAKNELDGHLWRGAQHNNFI